jgi:hypothetical protein
MRPCVLALEFLGADLGIGPYERQKPGLLFSGGLAFDSIGDL